MSTVNRRTFVQLSSGAFLGAASRKLLAAAGTPTITHEAGVVRVAASTYSWEYAQADDTFHIRDARNRLVLSGKLQPAVVVASVGQPSPHLSNAGQVSAVQVEGRRVTVEYQAVNGAARVSSSWRFDEHAIWTDPILYDTTAAHDVVSLHYFSKAGPTPEPTLNPSFIVAPGITSSGHVSPIQNDWVHLDTSVWLGRGSYTVGLNQQWALPVHYFCGFSTPWETQRSLYAEGRSDSFTCGLADLPNGDLFLQFSKGCAGPWVDYRGDLWGHLRGPAKFTLGATLLWTFAPDYYQSIAAYYEVLLQAGIIHPRQNSERKTAITLTPEFCTWGAQRVNDTTGDHLTDAFLDKLYRQFKDSGMKAGLFSIDDKWEGAYGNLVHSAERLPGFDDFLARLRADGLKIGMWAAVMRCEKPSDLGLTPENMLQTPDGKPFVLNDGTPHSFYILDFSQPQVAKVLTEVVKRFIRRYRPDVFKFDFGYELPALGVAAPKDKTFTGERLMSKGLEVVINAMREENPDQVVMYYNLSPLYLEYFDLHSIDDLVLSAGDYDVEANRRCFFSSLLGRLGVPTYGSSGYDWSSSPSIWFDSAALGTVGSLNSFDADEEGEVCTPEIIAKYNGITHVLRASTKFEILPIGNISQSATLGAHARSWARMENGNLVLFAYRPEAAGQERLLSNVHTDPRVKDLVGANVPVVVASKDSDSIGRTANLAVAPYGGGEITIRRQQGKQAAVVSHYFGGNAIKSTAAVEGGLLTLHAVERDPQGKPLEWIEVQIS